MKNNKITKENIYCILAAVIIIGCYATERLITLCIPPQREILLCEAIVFSMLILVTYLLILRSKNSFYGILIAILGLRMMPAQITRLGEFSPPAQMLYYIVGKAAIVIFTFAIIKLYDSQGYPRKIKPLPILCLLIAVPFTNEIADTVCNFILPYCNGNMLYIYFTRYAIYSATLIITLWYASACNKISARLICEYTLIALCVNMARRLCVISVYSAWGVHISRSYYCWVAIYVFFFIAFFIMRKKKMSTAK
ncbi:MAG: hypothetical protein ACI4RR_00605 [Eubacterium sp.]